MLYDGAPGETRIEQGRIMATWRRKDLERRSGERSRRMGRILRAEILIPTLALLIAAVALWQAMEAQSRAEVLARDLSIANGQLRNLGVYGSGGSAARPPGEESGAANAPPPALPPIGPTPSGTSPAGSNP